MNLPELTRLLMEATPGPWTTEYLDKNGQQVIKGEHTEIATFWHHCVGSLEKQMFANAALVCELRNAAPELTTACDERDRFRADVAKLKEQLAARERIRTPCPACGLSTLFVSDSGHLCCSLLGCPDPTRINNLREHEARLLEEMAKATDNWDIRIFLEKEAAARRTK